MRRIVIGLTWRTWERALAQQYELIDASGQQEPPSRRRIAIAVDGAAGSNVAAYGSCMAAGTEEW